MKTISKLLMLAVAAFGIACASPAVASNHSHGHYYSRGHYWHGHYYAPGYYGPSIFVGAPFYWGGFGISAPVPYPYVPVWYHRPHRHYYHHWH